MFVHTVIMVIEPHMKQGRQHKLISTIFLATSVTKKLDHNTSFTTRKKDNLWKADFVGTEESAAAKTWFTAVPEKAAAMESV